MFSGIRWVVSSSLLRTGFTILFVPRRSRLMSLSSLRRLTTCVFTPTPLARAQHEESTYHVTSDATKSGSSMSENPVDLVRFLQLCHINIRELNINRPNRLINMLNLSSADDRRVHALVK